VVFVLDGHALYFFSLVAGAAGTKFCCVRVWDPVFSLRFFTGLSSSGGFLLPLRFSPPSLSPSFFFFALWPSCFSVLINLSLSPDDLRFVWACVRLSVYCSRVLTQPGIGQWRVWVGLIFFLDGVAISFLPTSFPFAFSLLRCGLEEISPWVPPSLRSTSPRLRPTRSPRPPGQTKVSPIFRVPNQLSHQHHRLGSHPFPLTGGLPFLPAQLPRTEDLFIEFTRNHQTSSRS